MHVKAAAIKTSASMEPLCYILGKRIQALQLAFILEAELYYTLLQSSVAERLWECAVHDTGSGSFTAKVSRTSLRKVLVSLRKKMFSGSKYPKQCII